MVKRLHPSNHVFKILYFRGAFLRPVSLTRSVGLINLETFTATGHVKRFLPTPAIYKKICSMLKIYFHLILF